MMKKIFLSVLAITYSLGLLVPGKIVSLPNGIYQFQRDILAIGALKWTAHTPPAAWVPAYWHTQEQRP